MFGQQNNGDNNQQNDQGQPINAGTPTDTTQSPAAPPANHQFTPPKPAYDSVFDDNQPADASLSPSSDDAPAAPATDAKPLPTSGAPLPGTAPADDGDLLNIKKQALEQLSPLVGQLEQNPEEKFHTTMRIIQASDNHALIKDAFDAAKQITDDKVRAQALLDIVNEINYFTKSEEVEEPSQD